MKINTEALIAAAGKKLGIPEDKLRKAVNDGNVNELRSYLSQSDNEKLDKALGDKKFTDEAIKKYMAGK